MCTAITLRMTDHYFGRNLDLEYHYNEEVVITPCKYTFPFRNAISKNNYPIIGMATVVKGIPLYYDATNIHGLSMAGLNFPGNSVYHPFREGFDNIASFEVIPWVLQQCRTVKEAKILLQKANFTNTPFNKSLAVTPLHWIVSDSIESMVIESVEKGIAIYNNPTDVLTNNPPFPYHIDNLCNYLNLTNRIPSGVFIEKLGLKPYSNGMGGVGLPGDLSSASRFVKATYLLTNSACEDTENNCISQFFHILDSVSHTRGSVMVNDEFEITYYSSCCNATKGIYYYKTYDNSRITAVDMHKADLNTDKIVRFPLQTEQDIFWVNH